MKFDQISVYTGVVLSLLCSLTLTQPDFRCWWVWWSRSSLAMLCYPAEPSHIMKTTFGAAAYTGSHSSRCHILETGTVFPSHGNPQRLVQQTEHHSRGTFFWGYKCPCFKSWVREAIYGKLEQYQYTTFRHQRNATKTPHHSLFSSSTMPGTISWCLWTFPDSSLQLFDCSCNAHLHICELILVIFLVAWCLRWFTWQWGNRPM